MSIIVVKIAKRSRLHFIARQFGNPHGFLGRLIAMGMAKSNEQFAIWTVAQLREIHTGHAGRVAELGPGPGVGLRALLVAYPEAEVWGVDISRDMIAASRKLNVQAADAGRLKLAHGGVEALAQAAPLDIVAANHVIYFWPDPPTQLRGIRNALRPGGSVALGYQLRSNMPAMAQKTFTKLGSTFYDSDDGVDATLRSAGLELIERRIKGPADAPEGRLVVARRA